MTAHGTCDYLLPDCESEPDCAASCDECGLLPCGKPSRFAVERSDHDPSYDAAIDRAATETCEQHLAGTVVGLLDGDDRGWAIVTPRWDP